MPAFATQGLSCTSIGHDVVLNMSLGTAGGLSIVGASMQAGDANWVTDPAYGEGTIFMVGQSFFDGEELKADFFDAHPE